MDVDTKVSLLWTRTAIIILIPTLFSFWVMGQTDSYLFICLPWLVGPVMGVLIAWNWNHRRKLPPAPPTFVPSPLLAEGCFALSGTQFFPLRKDYREEPPVCPRKPSMGVQQFMAWLALILAIVRCSVPLLLAGASLVAILLAVLNPAGFHGKDQLRPMPIQRMTVLACSLGVAGIWSGLIAFINALN